MLIILAHAAGHMLLTFLTFRLPCFLLSAFDHLVFRADFFLVMQARHDGQNYVFSLLLGYRDPPAGVNIREGLHYNPYFIGGAIAMPKMLVDEGTEYDDGTPATESQQAKVNKLPDETLLRCGRTTVRTPFNCCQCLHQCALLAAHNMISEGQPNHRS